MRLLIGQRPHPHCRNGGSRADRLSDRPRRDSCGRPLRLQSRVRRTVLAPDQAKVTVNGADAAATFGKAANFIESEDGKDQSALILRDVTLAKAGTYRFAPVTAPTAAS